MLNLTFHDLQFEVIGWASRNFPDSEHWQPLLGAVEELGELAHSHLKESQGIRKTSEEHQIKAKDAIGDIIIYLAHYCSLRGLGKGGGDRDRSSNS